MDARACNENAQLETLFNWCINAVAVYVNARFGLGIRNVCKRCIFALRSPTIHLRFAADFAVKNVSLHRRLCRQRSVQPINSSIGCISSDRVSFAFLAGDIALATRSAPSGRLQIQQFTTKQHMVVFLNTLARRCR